MNMLSIVDLPFVCMYVYDILFAFFIANVL